MPRRTNHLRTVLVLTLAASAMATLSPAIAGTRGAPRVVPVAAGGPSSDRQSVEASATPTPTPTPSPSPSPSVVPVPVPNPDPQESFTINCDYTRSLTDDPIVFPNQPGASHLHDYFGNVTADAFSTYDSMLGQATSCENEADTAGYWAPAVFVGGVKVEPKNLKAYYYERIAASQPFPPGLGMIAGDSRALGPQSTKKVYFGCGSGSGLSKVNYMPNCTGTGGELTVHVLFPYCLNPTTNAVAYPPCPAGYTTTLPQLVERIIYPIVDARTVTLASGPGYTYHADFYNSWDQEALTRLLYGLPPSGN